MSQNAQFDPWYNLPILGPYAVAITTLTAAAIAATATGNAAAADPTRAGIIFHNPGTKNKRVMPAGSALVGGTGGILIYPQSEYILLQQPGSPYNVNCGWNAVTDDASDGSLTVLDFSPSAPNTVRVMPTTRQLQQIPVTSPVGVPSSGIGTGSVAVLSADPQRMGVQFHNPGTITLAVCPANLAALIGAGSLILLPGDTKTIKGNDRIKVNCGWNAIAASGSNNALTALGLYG